MLSPRRCAQLGLGAASLVLVSSVAVLVSGASDAPALAQSVSVAQATPLAQGPIAGVSTDAVDRLSIAKR